MLLVYVLEKRIERIYFIVFKIEEKRRRGIEDVRKE